MNFDHKTLATLFTGVSEGNLTVLELGPTPKLSENYLVSLFKLVAKIKNILLELAENDLIVIEDGNMVEEHISSCIKSIKEDIDPQIFEGFSVIEKADVELFIEEAGKTLMVLKVLKARTTVAKLFEKHTTFGGCTSELKGLAVTYGLRSDEVEYANLVLLNKEFRDAHPVV